MSRIKTPVKAPKKVTISDVARHMGVAKSTVSRAINGHAEISEARRASILEAACAMNFQVSPIARSLSKKTTLTLGVYTGSNYHLSLRNGFVVEILRGLQDACDEYHYDLLFHSAYKGRTIEDICSEFRSGKADGLLLLDPHPEMEKFVHESAVPVVCLGDSSALLPSINVDDAGGARLIVELLVERGHRRILYRKRGTSPSAVARLEAFRALAQEHCLVVHECLVDEEGVTREEKKLLGAPPSRRPTAVVAWEDIAAFHMCAHCRAQGLRVPEDVAVIGFNGSEMLGTGPVLTTVLAPWRAVAYQGVELLLAQLEGKNILRHTVLPVTLRRGETV